MKFKNLIIPLILFLFSFWQLNSVTKSYWLSSHDGIFHVLRIREYYYELTHGQFPVRWADRLDNNYGLPVFNYVYPGPYLLATIPMSFGISDINSYKIILFFGYFIGVLGFYYLLKKKHRYFAFIAALIYGLTPYLFLNFFVRGALGEVLAMGFMPWVLYFFIQKKRLLSCFSLAVLLISHNFLGILFLFFLIVYLVVVRQLNRFSLTSLALGLILSAFFLVPLIFEKQFISSGANNNYTFNYQEHFVYIQQLFYGKWDYWYSLPGPNDGMSFQIGFASIATLLISTIVLFFYKKTSLVYKFLFFSIIFSLFLTLTYSQWLWLIIKPLQIVQFPWRFLFMSTILTPIIFFKSFLIIHKKYPLAAFILSVLLVVLALYNTRNYRRPMQFQNQVQYQLLLDIYDHKTTTAARGEVGPVWSKDEKFTGGKVLFNQSSVDLNDNKFTLSNLSQPTEVTIKKNYFPGWQLINTSTSQSVPINPDSSGNIVATLTNSSYQLIYSGTVVQHLSDYLSLICFAYLLISSIRTIYKKHV